MSLILEVAFAAAAVKGLRYASINSANCKQFAAPLTAFLTTAGRYIRAADAAIQKHFVKPDPAQRQSEYHRYQLVELLGAVIPVSHTHFGVEWFAWVRF